MRHVVLSVALASIGCIAASGSVRSQYIPPLQPPPVYSYPGPSMPPQPYPSPTVAVGTICVTNYVACRLMQFGPIGLPCYCPSQYGAIPGVINR